MAGGAFDAGPGRMAAGNNPLLSPFMGTADYAPPSAAELVNEFNAFIIQQLDQLTGLDFTSATTLWNSLLVMFQNGVTEFINAIIGPSGLVAMLDDGLIPFSYFTNGIPAALITSLETPNLLFNGLFLFHNLFWTFPSGWILDQNKLLGGAPTYAAQADSTLQQGFGQKVYVTPGQTVNVSCQVAYTNLISHTYAPGGFELDVQFYDIDANPVSIQPVQIVATNTTGVNAGITLSGSVTVPGSGVFFVAPVLTVNDTAMGGTIWFGDIDLTKSGLISQNFIEGLETALSEAGSGNWDDLLSLLGLADVPGLATYLNTASANANDAWTNFENLFTGTGQGSGTTLASWLSSIETNATNAWNNFLNLFSGTGQSSGTTLASWLSGIESAAANAVTTGNYDTLLTALFGGTTVGSTVSAAAVPGIDASKVVSGSFAQTFVTGLTDVWDWLTGTTTPTSSTQVLAASVASVTGAANLGTDVTSAGTLAQGGIDAVNMGVTGTTQTGATAAVAQTAAAGLAATVAQVQSSVQSLQNAGDAVIGGVQILDDGPGTNATGAGWGSNWTLNSGSNANLARGFQCLGGNAIGSYTGATLNTDNMVAGIIFNSLPQYNWLGDPADGARHRIKIRESSDRSSCVFADIWHDKVQIGYRKANVDAYIGSATTVTAATGSNWELYGGDAAGTTPYLFQLIRNGVIASPIVQWNDTGHLSNLGSSYRGNGQDMYSDGSYYPGNTKYHARDLIQPTLKAMVALHRNTSTAGASFVSGGSLYRFPVGWFNTQDYLQPGITMATSNAGYQVSVEALYEFSFAVGLVSGVTGSPYIIAPAIWLNSAPESEGEALISQNGTVGGLSMSMCKSVYLRAGDIIYPAFETRSNQWGVLGESTGVISWMQLAQVG